MNLFSRQQKSLIGMIHLGALPGAPRSKLDFEAILAAAVAEAKELAAAGFDAVLVENMHDRPYLKEGHGPELAACMAVAVREVRREVALPCGIQILAAANQPALAAALASGACFIRAEGFAYAHVADEGIIDGCAGALLRYRREIGAESVAVVADIKKKHASHALTADVGLAETARTAEFLLADAVVVTGTATGEAVAGGDLEVVREATTLPVAVGSGASASTVASLLQNADAVIVGSDLKVDGRWEKSLDPVRARAFVEAAHSRS